MHRSRRTEHSQSQRHKRHSLLQGLHRRGTASRLHLARALRISNSRVCDLIDQMLDEGLLTEDAGDGERRGRRGVSVRLNPKYGHLLGFDMEAKRLRLVLTDFAGELVWQTMRPLRPPKDQDDLLGEIFDFVDAGLAEARTRAKNILACGIASPGLTDIEHGVIRRYDLLPQAAEIHIRDLLSERLAVPCVIENNIRAMTLAEWARGAARGLHSFVCVAVRSGVGSGVVLNGRLLSGSHGLGGQIGHVIIPAGEEMAQWKNLERTVSETALGIDIESSGFHVSDEVARRTGEMIGTQLTNVAVLIDPEAIVLAGNVLRPDGPVWPHVIATFDHTGLPEIAKSVKLLPAELGAFAAAQGAAYRCIYELFPAMV
jgi:predicted NBD/HSP70 family sugar kinase